MIVRTTHDADRTATIAYYRSLTPDERVALTVELSQRMRQLQVENGRAFEEVSSLTKRRRR